MSTLVVETIKHTNDTTLFASDTSGQLTVKGEGTATTNLQQGLVKSWLNFNGTGTIASRDSFNHSSLTDVSQGNYTVTMASAMANVNYTCAGACANTGAASGPRFIHFGTNYDSGTLDANFTTTSYSVNVFFAPSSAEYDAEYNFNQVCGDLA